MVCSVAKHLFVREVRRVGDLNDFAGYLRM